MPYEPHRDLNTPADDTVLWRYMDLAKFLLILERRVLWFPRQDQFDDPLEGTFTDAEREHIQSLDTAITASSSPVWKSWQSGPNQMRATAYVSCWRASAAESMAMWDLYGKGSGTVALKTTVGRLKEAIAKSALRIFLAEVKYIDWSLAPFDNNALVMCFRKDSSYEHEKELRAVIWDQDIVSKNMSDALIANRSRGDYTVSGQDPFILRKDEGQLGLEIPFEPALYVTEVVVGPREPDSIIGLVKSIMDRYGLKTKITVSNRLKPRM